MSQLRVLLADPDAALLARYRSYLSKEGFIVATAQTGLECLEQLCDAAPDVLVLDPKLLAECSEGVFDILADVDDPPWVHMIVLTTDDVDLPPRLAKVAVNAWHAKPLAPSALAQHIRRLLKLPAHTERFVTEWA